MGLTTDPEDPALRQHDAFGMQKSYLVLSDEERAKGFVRPVRLRYVHVGPTPPAHPLRDLTEDEKVRFENNNYVAFEAYPESEAPVLGRYWTQAQLDNKGCGSTTTMNSAIAETYARDPGFYGGTYCAHCAEHFPVGAQGEFVWEGTNERVGT